MAQQERWGSRIGLVLAMAGNAVGLGNFIRFPAEAARNGGGAFLIPYFVALILMGLPLMWVEWAMGRRGGEFGQHSAPGIFQTFGRSGIWKYLGVLGLWSCMLIAAFYLYVETWCFAYAAYSFMGGFQNEAPTEFLNRLIGTTPNSVFAVSYWGLALFFGCIVLNIYILSRGLARGIEMVAKVAMPMLIVFAVVLAVRGLMITPDNDPKAQYSALTGLNFVWEPKLDKLTNPTVWLAAAGQIFFTLSIGMGAIHCYSSYLRRNDDIALTGATTAWTNEFCEVILAGTILIPISVAYLGLDKVQEMTQGGSGFDLGFMTLPTLFNDWGPFAPFAGFLWFGLLFLAAITSSLAIGQPFLAFLQSQFGMTRRRSAMVFGVLLLPLALLVATMDQNCFFNEYDFWAGTFALVVFAIIETILFAWVFGMDRGWEEITRGAELRVPRVFYYILKYITPVFIFIILLGSTFLPKGEVKVVGPDGSERIESRGWEPYVTAPFTGEPMPEWKWSPQGLIGKMLNVDLDDQVAAVTAEKAKATGDKLQELLEKERYLGDVYYYRSANRILMAALFAFLAFLVFIAWLRRGPEGSQA